MRASVHIIAALLLAGAASVVQPAQGDAAAGFPVRPIRVIVPFTAGGQADMFARLVAQKAGEALGQQLVVDNRAGAGGLVGTRTVADAAPDGYTLLSTSGAHTILPALRKDAYDVQRDFAGISMIYSAALVLVVPNTLNVKTVQELISLAKAKPGQINMASAGVGSGTHFAGEIFRHAAGIEVVHVPYKGIPEASNDIIAGRVQMFMMPLAPAAPLIKDGRMRALAVTTAKRTTVFPDLPTVDESGVKGYAHAPWAGMFAPAKTPRATIVRLNRAVTDALRLPETEKTMRTLAVEPTPTTPAETDRLVLEDAEKVRRAVKLAGIKTE
jgi:tripartite-type tricarboxylate transporter receptor subunit TctC